MTIYYWKGAEGSEKLLHNHQVSIRKLLTGDYNRTDLEKLSTRDSQPIYSFRLNKKARLLFTDYQGCLHVLEFLPNHEYHKSKFLKKGILTQYLEHSDIERIAFTSLSTEESLPSFQTDDGQKTVGLEYYNQQFVCMSDEQTGVMSRVQLPLILHAEAGAGKTFLGTMLMAQQSNPEARVLYVTQESGLVEQTRLNYLGLCGETAGNAEFKTYNELVIPFSDTTEAGAEEAVEAGAAFMAWYGGLKASACTYTAIKLAQEFRTCSGYTGEAYTALGERQSSIPKAERAAVYALYQRYLAYLEQNQQKDWAFYAFECAPTYDLVIVDEALRFSLRQLLQLEHLAKNHAIVYCMDSNQNMADTQPVRVLLEQLLQPYHVTTERLSQQYRYSEAVVIALNKVLEVKRLLVGGKLDKQEVTEMSQFSSSEKGTFLVLSPDEALRGDRAWMAGRDGHLAVVTTPELRAEAAEAFDTPLIFTPEQIQGQEFHTVVVYHYLSSPESHKALSKLKDLQGRLSPQNRAKSGESTSEYAPWISTYFTACSRAKNTLVLVENINKKTNVFLNLFQPKTELKDCVEKAPAPVPVLKPADWGKILEEQRARGNTDVVERIKKTRSAPKKPGTLVQPAKADVKKINAPNAIKYDEKISHDLLNACMRSDLNKMGLLIKSCVDRIDLNVKNSEGLSLLLCAANSPHPGMLDLLMPYAERIDFEAVSSNGYTALMSAAQTGRFDSVKTLLKYRHLFDINQVNDRGLTALFCAVRREEYTDIVEYLVDACPELELNHFETITQSPALIIAAQRGYVDIVRILVSCGERLNVNQVNVIGDTALTLASCYGQIDVVRILLSGDMFLDLNKRDSVYKYTALSNAVMKNHLEIVDVLLTQGSKIDPDLMGNGDISLFSILNERVPSPPVIMSLLGDERILKATLEKIIHQPELIKPYPVLLIQLMKKRADIMPILDSSDGLNLTRDEHLDLLKTLHSSHGVSQESQHPLYKVLFKTLRSTPGVFQEQGLSIDALQERINALELTPALTK